MEYKGIKGQPQKASRIPWGRENPPSSSSYALTAEDGPESYDSQEEKIVFMEMANMPNEVIELLKSEIAAAETLGAASTAPTPLSASCSGFIGVTDLCQYPSLANPAPGYVAPAISQRLATSMFGLIEGR